MAILPNFVMGPVTSPTAGGTSVDYMKVFALMLFRMATQVMLPVLC